MMPIATVSSLANNPKHRDPIFGQKLNIEGHEVALSDPKTLRALVAIMDMHAVLGGAACHYGGPAAFAEIVSVVYGIAFETGFRQQKPWHQIFNIVNDAGHCENIHYAVKANYGFAELSFEDLWKFRSIASPLTGHGENHLFPEGVLLSNGPLGSAIPQSQGLALGDHLIKSQRVTISLISDGAIMEGEAKEALAAIAGFAQKGQLAPYVMIISDNNTKLTGRIDEDSYSLAPTFESLVTLGWEMIRLEQGNDLLSCYQAINKAIATAVQSPSKPVVVWAKTTKGMGHKKSVDSPSGGHGFSLKSAGELKQMVIEIYDQKDVPEPVLEWIDLAVQREQALKSEVKPSVAQAFKTEKVQVGIAKALIKAAQSDLPVMSVTSDLPGSTGLAEFRKQFPQLSIDVGVAESNMVSVAAGLSKQGFIPVVDTFAQFGVTKGALPLLMSSLSQAPIIGVFSHIGFQDAADGASHQALNYLAMVKSIPNVEVWSLSCAEEADSLVTAAINEFAEARSMGKTPSSYLFFLGRENFPSAYHPDASYKLREPLMVKDNTQTFVNSVLIIAMGTLIPEAIKASETLRQQGIGSLVIHPGYLTRPNVPLLKSYLNRCQGRVVFVEDHQKIGGYAESWITYLQEQGITLHFKALGVQAHFGQSAYNAIELYQMHGLDSEAIFNASLNLISR